MSYRRVARNHNMHAIMLRCEACLDGAEDFDEVMRLKDH